MIKARLPESDLPRIVIIGAGFAGLKLAQELANKAFQVVLIDKNNFHQFQPLFYQVATAGLAPSAISFPIRKALQKEKNVHFRMAEVELVNLEKKFLHTSVGEIDYDKLVIAIGADTNYFGNKALEKHAFPMKSVQESLALRNRLLQCVEEALVTESKEERKALLNVVIVGGGPTGTEVAGALSEMKRFVLPKDFPEIDFSEMTIYLLEASKSLLSGMQEKSSQAAKEFLEEMGVQVKTKAMVEDYDGEVVRIKGGEEIHSKNLIWAAGVKGNALNGIPEELIKANARITVNEFNQIKGYDDAFAIGDIALLNEKDSEQFSKGHPQVAQVAIQQAVNLAKNFDRNFQNPTPFKYKDLGSMATVGRSKAVVDLPKMHFKGFFAWMVWLFVHLMAILGVKNKFFIFIDWLWYYISFDQNLRLVIKPKEKNKPNN